MLFTLVAISASICSGDNDDDNDDDDGGGAATDDDSSCGGGCGGSNDNDGADIGADDFKIAATRSITKA